MKTRTMRGNSLTIYRDGGNDRAREKERDRRERRENSIYLRV
jgi:hypothetical protein